MCDCTTDAPQDSGPQDSGPQDFGPQDFGPQDADVSFAEFFLALKAKKLVK